MLIDVLDVFEMVLAGALFCLVAELEPLSQPKRPYRRLKREISEQNKRWCTNQADKAWLLKKSLMFAPHRAEPGPEAARDLLAIGEGQTAY